MCVCVGGGVTCYVIYSVVMAIPIILESYILFVFRSNVSKRQRSRFGYKANIPLSSIVQTSENTMAFLFPTIST